jgi:hypothetical protein
MGISLMQKLRLLRQLNSTVDTVEEGIKMKNSTKIIGAVIALLTSLLGIPSVQAAVTSFLGTHPVVSAVIAAVTAILALLHNPVATPGASSASSDQGASTAKLGVLALISLLLVWPCSACSATTVAQDIVNWTPTIVSAATTIDATVAALDPANAGLILLAGTTFTAVANLVEAQAKTYLANPNATTLQQLQAQATAFQGNVTTALLQAARITNAASQQKVTVAINAAVTGISAILALITTIKGSTITPASVTTPKLAALAPLIDRGQAVQMVATHYGISYDAAALEIDRNTALLMRAGF